MSQIPITPYPGVNAALGDFRSRVEATVVAQVAGIYLHGSLAPGDFDPRTSDIDFVVVTVDELAAAVIPAIEAMHAGIAAGGLGWGSKFEGAHLSRATLRRHDSPDRPRPYVNEGRFQVAPLGSDWVIQRHALREHGITVLEPSPRTVIDPISPGDLRRAVRQDVTNWWAPMLRSPDPRLFGRTYQAYAVLSMCRVLYTIRHGAVASKPVSARWALQVIDNRWHDLIERAVARPGGTQPDQFGETLAFIRYTVAHVDGNVPDAA